MPKPNFLMESTKDTFLRVVFCCAFLSIICQQSFSKEFQYSTMIDHQNNDDFYLSEKELIRKFMSSNCCTETSFVDSQIINAKEKQINQFSQKQTTLNDYLLVSNATLMIKKAFMMQKQFGGVAKTNRNSLFWCQDCSLIFSSFENASTFEACGGCLRLQNVSVTKFCPFKEILPLTCGRNDVYSQHQPKIKFGNCEFNSLFTERQTSILGCGDVEDLEIHECSFLNISQKFTKYNTKHRYCSSSKWIGCSVYSSMFHGCSNAQFGSIIVPTNEKLLLLNSSFEDCSVTHSPQNGTENAYSTGDVIASSVIFSDLSSSTTVGLAMRLSGNATLRATNCSFLNVNSSLVNEGLYGGAVSHIGNGFHFSYGCNYSNCSAGYAGGGLNSRSSAIQSVKCCIFEHCKSRHYSGLFCYYQSNGTVFANNYVLYCIASYYTAGMGVCFTKCYPILSECVFGFCENNANYGTLSFVWESANNTTGIVQISFCYFENNTIGATDCGCDISSWGNKIYDEKVIFDSFVSSYSSSTQPCRVTIGWADRSEWLPLLPETAPYVFVSSIFGDDNKENCGFGGIPCETIPKGMLKRTNSQPLIVEEGSYIHDEIAVSSTNVTLRGEDPETSTLISSNTEEGKALFDVTVGYLSISRFTVIHSNKNSNPGSAVLRMRGNGKIEISDSIFRGEEAGSVASTTSMIILEGGETTMNSVSFSLFTSMCQLVSFSTPSQLSVKSVVFDSVRRTVGNGAIFEGRLKNNEICEMNNITFSGCECSEGNGGGIWMELERGSMFFVGNTSDGSGTVVLSGCKAKQKSASNLCGCGGGIYLWVGDEADTFALKRVRFNDCKASKGNNVFVNASRLIGLVNTATIGFNLSLSDFDCARGSERSTTGDEFWIPLVVYLWSNLTTFAHVGGTEGADFSRCGFAEIPCETIGQAVSVRFEEKNRYIELHNPFVLKEELNLKGYEWMIMASLNGTSIELEQEGTGNTKGMIEVQTKALLSGICFAIPETLGSHEAVVQCDSGAFNMAECGVGAKRGAISYSFLRVSGGQVTVNRLAVKSMEFSAGSLLKITEIGDENCTLSVSESTFESISTSEGNILLCEGEANVNISDCTIKKVLSSKQNGGGVSILFLSSTKQKIVGIDNCTFDECAVLDGGGCGGGMFGLISDSTVLKLTECSFSGCAAPSGEEEGFGGGIYLQLMEESIDFVVSAPIFPSSKPNAASHGRDLFIRSPNLKRTVSSDTFPFVEEADKVSMESMEGIDGDDTDAFIPLILFFREIEGKIYTSSQSGVNTVVCGFEEYPCLSIDYSLLRLCESVEKIVYVKDAVDMKEEVDLSDVELRGDGQEKAVLCVQEIMDGEGKKVMSTKSATHIVRLRVEAPLAFTNGTTVLIASDGVEGELEIEDCWFTMKGEEVGSIDYTLIESKGSFLWFVGVRVANIKTRKSLFILCNKQSSERNRENPSIQLKNCTFEGLEVQGADCSVLFESTLNVECLITENNMTNISSLESIEGGAMRCALGNNGMLCVSKSNISRCRAKTATSGKGGWLYLEYGSTATFKIESLLFGECDAYCGKNMYIRGQCLWNSLGREQIGQEISSEKVRWNEFICFEEEELLEVPLALFTSEWELPAYVEGESGRNYPLCGFEWFGCRSIVYAGDVRFKTGKAGVRLQRTFSFKDAVVLSSRGYDIDVENIGDEIEVEEGGSGEGAGLIKCVNEVKLSKMVLVLPSLFSPTARECLVLCEGSKVVLEKMGMKMQTVGKQCKYSLVKGVGGAVIISELNLVDFEFSALPAIELRGGGVIGNVDNLVIRNTKRNGNGGLVEIDCEAKMSIVNSSVCEGTFAGHCVLMVDETSELSLQECNVSDMSRSNGDGGGIVGVVGDGKKIEVKKCNFSRVSCSSTGSKGGCMMVRVMNRGMFLFDSNSVEGCKVPATEGFGGGLHLTLEDANLTYSMKSVAFGENDAQRGADVYLVCKNPRQMVDPLLWEGSAEVGEDESRKWVIDPSDERMNMTLLRFLFPSDDDIIYVDEREGKEVEGCGSSVSPCMELGYGYSKLGDTRTILHIQDSASLVSEIDRKDEKLMIRGEERKSEMIVGIHGHVMLSTGSLSTSLTFQNIIFTLPISRGKYGEVIKGKAGRVNVISCVFGGKPDSWAVCPTWIIRGEGSVVQIDNTRWEMMDFGTDSGICVLHSGILNVVGSTISEVNCSSEALFICSKDSSMVINDTCVMNCRFSIGSVIRAKNGTMVGIENGTSFERCTSNEGNGGCINCESVGNCSVRVKDVSFLFCGVNEMNGRGGAIYYWMFNDLSSEIEFSALSFQDNQAHEGRDVFVGSVNLNKSVTANRFCFKLFDDDGNQTSFIEGTDTTIFNGKAVDLALFLAEYTSHSVVVSPSGLDLVGCGGEKMPCQTFWSGFGHLEDSTLGMRNLQIEQIANVQDAFVMTNLKISSFATDSNCTLQIDPQLNTHDADCVFFTSIDVQFVHVIFSIPIALPPSLKSLIMSISDLSSSSTLILTNCSFNLCDISSVDRLVQCSLISTAGGFVELESCVFETLSFLQVPLEFESTVHVKNSSFVDVEAPESASGGAMKVTLGTSGQLEVNGGELKHCRCSKGNGRGGGMCVDCRETIISDLLELRNVEFEKNDAWTGKNIYVLSSDLNKTITTDSFAFDFTKSQNDSRAFVGSDLTIGDVDLLRFLMPYWNSEIFVSSGGFDLLHCGNENEPCFTFWMGMSHIDWNAREKMIIVEGETAVANEYELSLFRIVSSSVEREEKTKSKLKFLKKLNGSSGGYIINKENLTIELIILSVDLLYEGSAESVIVNEKGVLQLEKCCFEVKEAECSFIEMRKGVLEANDLSMKLSSTGMSVFIIYSGSICRCNELEFAQISISGGCVFEVKTKAGNSNESGMVCVNGSTFDTLERGDNGACIIHTDKENEIDVEVNGCSFVDDKSEESACGGVMHFCINSGGRLTVSDTTMMRCSCSMSGRGGGVYVSTDNTGELNFVFRRMKFIGNTAGVGNDIYVQCHNISRQINDTQFRFSLKEGAYSSTNAIYGSDTTDHVMDTNLMDFITIYESDMIIVSSSEGKEGKNERQCGTVVMPCASVGYGLRHLTNEVMSMLLVDEKSVIEEAIVLDSMTFLSRMQSNANIEVVSDIEQASDTIIEILNSVTMAMLSFKFPAELLSLHASFISVKGGSLEANGCTFSSLNPWNEANSLSFHLVYSMASDCTFDKCVISNLFFQESVFKFKESYATFSSCSITDLMHSFGVVDHFEGRLEMINTMIGNISRKGESSASVISGFSLKVSIKNCLLKSKCAQVEKGSLADFMECSSVEMEFCTIEGRISSDSEEMQERANSDEACSWNGSLVDFGECQVMMKDTVVCNSSFGGISFDRSNVTIENGEFMNNNPMIGKYPSIRRNIVCSDDATVNVVSLKGGDGAKENSSLWMLNKGCNAEGMLEGLKSVLFIPVLDSVSMAEEGAVMSLSFRGALFIQCKLGFEIVTRMGSTKLIEKWEFSEGDFASEAEVHSSISSAMITSSPDESEVAAAIIFGEKNAETDLFVLKNRSEPQTRGDGKLVEGGKEGKSSLSLIVIIMAIVLLIVLVALIIFVIRWRKQKRRTEELEVIVEDTVKKDPKAFEMVTMEMSPEEQWRRAEREAEKKNEERIKKRINGKEMVHSESSEHLLSESGSTEYILGRDSDKIPDWALEKEEEEEIRKRTPSPSISSTSTTSTTDSDSTFVRSECLCPTTSSMSNLVDAMACSSPHEKLIVDLRDSLFMLLHGRNEKKEMAIGTLEEREVTAAQIMFWVANGVLHCFDELKVELQSLDGLSPHIVLFSEHMVICIAMHSDCSTDSDSSSISSSTTVVTSASDDESDSLPSSSFEDEEEFKKECLRWKAPELVSGAKKHATKKTVVFSIGMMVWECVTLKMPFGEYDGSGAGELIVEGARPRMEMMEGSRLSGCVKECVLQKGRERPELGRLKREFFGYFPSGATMVTATDAIWLYEGSDVFYGSGGICSSSDSDSGSTCTEMGG